MHKKAMELSINFIVMLIIALVVFGMGLVLFKKFFVAADDIKQNLDDQTRKELQAKMMASSDEVVIYPTEFTVQKGKSDVIGVGILNIGAQTSFTIKSEYISCYNRDGQDITAQCSPSDGSKPIRLYDDQNPTGRTVTVLPNKREIFDVPFKVNSDVGTAKFSVKITVEGTSQTYTSLVYIDVP
jgi:hypothetical protein